jgi:hypothetical protein
MCVFLCTSPKLQRWITETVVRSERDALRLIGMFQAPPTVNTNDRCENTREERLRSGRNRLIRPADSRPLKRKNTFSCSVYFYSASCEQSADRPSSYERKGALQSLADAWSRLLVLFGWRC